MARKQKFDYFEAFAQIAEHAVEYAEQLVIYLEKNIAITDEGRDPNVEHALQRYEELHKIETASDEVKHDIITHLNTEFIAPLEREDIMMLASELDDLVDDLDEILQVMYMYDIHSVPQSVVDMIKLDKQAVDGVLEVVKELRHFKKDHSVKKYVVAVNDIEDEADRVYIRAMHEGYASIHEMANPRSFFSSSQLLTVLEDICDACEEVCDTVAMIIMKNS